MLPRIIINYSDERKTIKKDMLAAMQKNQRDPWSEETEREINRLENRQMAIKILLKLSYMVHSAINIFSYFNQSCCRRYYYIWSVSNSDCRKSNEYRDE